ncbi:MAG: DUF1540 domain-containing protein [Clostridiales bacterium]|jgi:hypothetical protein|nr:DUF1540 domain-containing protein [Clostridiales bacterium]
MDTKNHNQQINCTVTDCLYNETTTHGCNLKSIIVCPDAKEDTNEDNPSACDSFEYK